MGAAAPHPALTAHPAAPRREEGGQAAGAGRSRASFQPRAAHTVQTTPRCHHDAGNGQRQKKRKKKKKEASRRLPPLRLSLSEAAAGTPLPAAPPAPHSPQRGERPLRRAGGAHLQRSSRRRRQDVSRRRRPRSRCLRFARGANGNGWTGWRHAPTMPRAAWRHIPPAVVVVVLLLLLLPHRGSARAGPPPASCRCCNGRP